MPAPTFTTCLSRSLTKAAVVMGLAVCLMGPVALHNHGHVPHADVLLLNPACWHDMGEHPKPTRVVVDVAGEWVTRGGATVDDAVEQAVYGIDHGLAVVEFCA